MTKGASTEGGRDASGLDTVMTERRQLISLAYRLLGSLAEAEDVVQETYTRWYACPTSSDARSRPRRLALEGRRPHLPGPARLGPRPAGRYVGDWIPEPVPGGPEWDDGSRATPWSIPAERVTLDESLSMAFLVVLETMTPAERVAFILHDVFRYSFAEVAEIVGRTPAACRQLASSARRRIDARSPPHQPKAPQASSRISRRHQASQGHRRARRAPRPRHHDDPRRRRPRHALRGHVKKERSRLSPSGEDTVLDKSCPT